MPLSIARAIWKHRLQILAVWLLGTAACVAIVYHMQPVYSASAVILVESQQIPEAFVAATVQTPLEARLDMLKQQILSRDFLWGLIEQFGLYPRQRRKLTKDEVLQIMRDDIKMSLVRGWSSRGPGAFEVNYEAPQAAVAAEVANRVGTFFIDENLRQRTGEAVATSDFLNRELADAETLLRQNEATLKEFKLSHNGELPQQETALLASMGQSKAELLGIQDALGRAQQNKLILDNSITYLETTVRQARAQRAARQAAGQSDRADLPAVTMTEEERVRRELAAARLRYYDSHPEVQRLLVELDRAKRLDAERKPAPAPAAPASRTAERPDAEQETAIASDEATRLKELQAQQTLLAQDVANLEHRRQRVLDEFAGTQAKVRNIPVREQQLAAITRDYETCKANYQSLLNKKLAADVAANMERWQKSQKLVMLDKARIPQKPKRPQRVLLSLAGSVFMLIFGTAAAFVRELRKNALLGEWELPAGMPVLGRIPRLTQ